MNKYHNLDINGTHFFYFIDYKNDISYVCDKYAKLQFKSTMQSPFSKAITIEDNCSSISNILIGIIRCIQSSYREV